MRRIFLFLVVGILIMSSACWAEGNRTAVAGADANKASILAAIQGAAPQLSAADQKAQLERLLASTDKADVDARAGKEAAIREAITQLSTTAGGIGKVNIKSADLVPNHFEQPPYEGFTRNAIKVVYATIAEPTVEKTEFIPVKEMVKSEDVIARLESQLPASKQRDWLVGLAKQVFAKNPTLAVMADNFLGIGGIGMKGVIAPCESINDAPNNPMGWTHEILEAARDMGIITQQNVLDQLTGLSYNGQTAQQWIDAHMALGQGRDLVKWHYVLRAFQRMSFGDLDVAFTRQVKKYMEVFDGVKAAKPNIKASKYKLLVYDGKGDKVTALFRERLGQASAKGAAISTEDIATFRDENSLRGEVLKAKKDGYIPLVVTSKDIQLTALDAFKGVAIVAADLDSVDITGNPIPPQVIDNIISAAMFIDDINKQVEAGKLTEAQLVSDKRVISLQAIIAELRGIPYEQISIDDIKGLLAIKDNEPDGLRNRLVHVIRLLLLPAKAISAEKTQEILATRSIILSA